MSLRRTRSQSTSERGAILVFSAVLLLVLVGFAALAVDLGNAWSNDRRAQTAADISATSGLFAIPRTFNDSGTALPKVTTEALNEILDLLATNAPSGVPIVAVSGDALNLNVRVTIDSTNSFARAIGAGDATPVSATASGRIEIQPYDTLRPFGLYNAENQPYQCYEVFVPSSGTPTVCDREEGDDVDILHIFRLDPPSCLTPVIPNLRFGVDHLVDTDASIRTSADACSDGHILTMPNEAGTYFAFASDLTEGLTAGGGPLDGVFAPLWSYLVPGQPGSCNRASYASPPSPYDVMPLLEGQSLLMRECLRTPNGPEFEPDVINSPRFSWAIRTTSDIGSRHFDDLTLIFLNTIISDGALLTLEESQVLHGPDLPPGTNVGAVTFYELDIGWLADSDQAGLREPRGIDYLEFSLTS